MKDNPDEWQREIIQSFEEVPFYNVVLQEQELIGKCVYELGWEAIWNKFYHSGVAECYSPEVLAKRSEAQMRPETRKAKSIAMKVTMNKPEMKNHLARLTKIQMSKPGAKKAIIEGQMGEKNHFYGKHHSAEHIARLRTDNPSSRPEVGAKIAEAQRGRKKMIDLDGRDRRVKLENIESKLSEGWKLYSVS